MKILHVISSMDPKSGGPCQGIRNSAEAFRDLGCSKEVVCLNDPRSPYLGNDSFPIHALGKGWGALAYHPALVPWLISNLDRYDAVIVNGIWQWHSIATWLAIRKLKKSKAKAEAKNEKLKMADGRLKVRFHKSAPSEDFRARSDELGYLTTNCQLPTTQNIPRYFVMPHGMLDPWFQRAKSRRLKAIRNWFYWKLVEHRVIRDAEALFFTCEDELLLARTTFTPYQPKREINVGYGIVEPPHRCKAMDEAFRAKCPDLPEGQSYLLFLSRIHPKKGVDLLIRAYAKVCGKAKSEKPKVETSKLGSARSLITDNPSLDSGSAQSTINNQQSTILPALVIAGPLDSVYAKQMIRLAESLLPGSVFTPTDSSLDLGAGSSGKTEMRPSPPSPLTTNYQLPASMDGGYEPSIHFAGMLQGDAKWGVIYGCEAFVLPSHQENFGIAVVEALACDKPVLISNQVNIWREIDSSHGGLIADDTPEGTRRTLTEWLQMTSEEKAAFQPRECFRKHFEVQGATENFVKVLKTYV
jgi:glycosyltransferase involved in cell wall biosynthesis